VNTRHIKNIPGRKTDISDSKWLAGLLRHGLVKGSFIPVENVRKWRELSRLRKTYTESLSDYKRRVHKLFNTVNIKIDSVSISTDWDDCTLSPILNSIRLTGAAALEYCR